jgi:uncharacterized phiE125 gp8 family phage protein
MRIPIVSKKIKTAPTNEPLDLTETKSFLDIASEDGTDDNMILKLIKAARSFFEERTYRRLITQTWYAYMNDWPGGEDFPNPDYVDEIEVPYPPLQSVSSIKYYDQSGTEYTFSSANYNVDISSEPGRIVLKDTVSWPTTLLKTAEGIKIEYICGYGSTYSNVPEDIQLCLMMLVQHWFHNRGDALKIPDQILEAIDQYNIRFL